jgi:hypothetical protein
MVNLFRPDTWGRRAAEELSVAGAVPSPRMTTKSPLPRSAAAVSTNDPGSLRDSIQQLAYYKWKQAGCPEGQDDRFWLEAEQELLSRPA